MPKIADFTFKCCSYYILTILLPHGIIPAYSGNSRGNRTEDAHGQKKVRPGLSVRDDPDPRRTPPDGGDLHRRVLPLHGGTEDRSAHEALVQHFDRTVCGAVAAASAGERPATVRQLGLHRTDGNRHCGSRGGAALWRLHTAKERVTREHNDKLYGRYQFFSGAQTALGLCALAGGIVMLCTNEFSALNLLLCCGAAAWAACGVVMYLLRGNLRMEELPQDTL